MRGREHGHGSVGEVDGDGAGGGGAERGGGAGGVAVGVGDVYPDASAFGSVGGGQGFDGETIVDVAGGFVVDGVYFEVAEFFTEA